METMMQQEEQNDQNDMPQSRWAKVAFCSTLRGLIKTMEVQVTKITGTDMFKANLGTGDSVADNRWMFAWNIYDCQEIDLGDNHEGAAFIVMVDANGFC